MRSTAEQQQLKRLRQSRAVATGMLALAAAVFAGSLAIPAANSWVLLVRSVAEAALVGGLADWFAVTALFRRPLRLPISHTAIVPANKDRIGEGLARFLDQHFLTRELLVAQLRGLRVSERLAAWMADRRNAAALAGEIAKALPFVLRAVDDRQIKAFLGRALGAQLRNAPLTALAGHFVRLVTAAGYHEAVLDRALNYARDFLARNEERLLDTVAERRRSWIPRAINREIARAMLRGAEELIEDLRKPDGAARQSLLSAIDDMAVELMNAPARSRGRASTVAEHPRAAGVARRVLGQGPRHSCSPTSLRRRRACAARSLWQSLRSERPSAMTRRCGCGSMRRSKRFWRKRCRGGELIRFVAEVVRKWEPAGFSDRIEMAVGADLQYIRMNGTIVGGLVGGGLFLLSLLAR